MPEPVAIRNLLGAATPTISVGVLTADLLALGSEIRTLERAGVRLVHFDVMDGCFCPMTTFGPPLIKAVKTPMLKDVHLLIEYPLDKIPAYVAAGADMITVHLEACGHHPHRVLQSIRSLVNANDPARSIAAGIALNPGTPLTALEPLLGELDMVFLLAVNPGWSGQGFIGTTRARAAKVLDLIRASGRDIFLGVDGGVSRDNIGDVVRMGADIIVTGSAVFDGKNAEANARNLLDAVAKARKV
jgi:ribulose-phosphate 3-epimerase